MGKGYSWVMEQLGWHAEGAKFHPWHLQPKLEGDGVNGGSGQGINVIK